MMFNLIEILGGFSVFLFLFFALYLVTTKTSKKLSNGLFAFYLLVIALDLTAFFYPKFITFSYSIEMLRMQVLADLKAPLLYLYIVSVLYDNFRLKIKHVLLFLPLFINLIILYPSFFNVNIDQQELFINNYFNQPEALIVTSIGYTTYFFLFFALVYEVIRYRKIINQNYSNSNALVNYTWITQFLVIDIIISLVTLSKSVYRFTYNNIDTTNNLRVIMLLSGLIFICWLFSKALLAPKVFQGVDANLTPIKEKVNTIEDMRIAHIQEFMKEKQPYLDASLTLQKLGHQLGIPSRELSILINQHIGKHFFDFVNGYRIEKAKELLGNTSLPKKTIQEVMYDVGFNSKNSFNTAFKKHTNSTPSQYRKNTSNQQLV